MQAVCGQRLKRYIGCFFLRAGWLQNIFDGFKQQQNRVIEIVFIAMLGNAKALRAGAVRKIAAAAEAAAAAAAAAAAFANAAAFAASADVSCLFLLVL